MARQIIFASAHRYTATPRLGTAYLAEAFAKRGWEVLFIEQPTSPFHFFFRKSRATAAAKSREALKGLLPAASTATEKPRAGVSVLNTISFLPHVNSGPFSSDLTLRNWWRMTLPAIGPRIVRGPFASAAAFVFDSPYFYPLARTLSMPVVYRYADRISQFASITPAMLKLQERVFRDSDLVVATADLLSEDFKLREKPSLYLPNGVDLSAFYADHSEPPALSSIPHPRVIYCGAIEAWFDLDLLTKAAQLAPDVNFVILGRTSTPEAVSSGVPNIHFLGEVPFSRVPAFLQQCQASIIPFAKTQMPGLVETINPLKLYEYSAAGLPVVSYRSHELEQMNAPIRTYNTVEDFVRVLREEISNDSENRRRARREWAASCSWEKRAVTLEQTIAQLPSLVIKEF